MGQLDQLLKDKQRQRDKLLDESKKIERLIRATAEKRDRLEAELIKDQKEYERAKNRKEADRDAHKNALQKLEDEETRLKRGIDEIHREIESAEQGIKSDLQLKAANDNKAGGSHESRRAA